MPRQVVPACRHRGRDTFSVFRPELRIHRPDSERERQMDDALRQNVYDVIVAGAGTMGSFACLELARRGVSALGIDRFTPPHDRGSHSGATRIFREAYAEGPEYVSLARQAGLMWDRFGEEAGTALLQRCGLLSIGPADGRIVRGIERSAAAHGLPVERWSGEDVRVRYGVFSPPPGHIAMFDPNAGYIDVDRAIDFSISSAKRSGAEFLFNAPVERWSSDGREVRVHTPQATVAARALIIAAGAWSASLLPASLPLQVLRRALIWADPVDPVPFRDIPVFMFEEQAFYGFPLVDETGVKMAVDLKSGGELAGPVDVSPPDKLQDAVPVMELAARWLPGLAGPMPAALDRVRSIKTCLYTMTPDINFIVDRHPEHENVWFAAGFSGHGFKFAPAIGAALADLAVMGSTTKSMDFLRMGNRFR